MLAILPILVAEHDRNGNEGDLADHPIVREIADVIYLWNRIRNEYVIEQHIGDTAKFAEELNDYSKKW